MANTEPRRCPWADGADELMREYHDTQWGKPCRDERVLFEMLILEGMQAGLSWAIILKKRESFREAFDSFDPAVMAGYDERKAAELLQNPGIIRNRLKIAAAITNAQAYQKLCAQYGSFEAFIWGYVRGEPLVNNWDSLAQIPVSTPLSDQISKDLKKLGFKFVGSTIIYSFLQAVGVVNDHMAWCDFRR